MAQGSLVAIALGWAFGTSVTLASATGAITTPTPAATPTSVVTTPAANASPIIATLVPTASASPITTTLVPTASASPTIAPQSHTATVAGAPTAPPALTASPTLVRTPVVAPWKWRARSVVGTRDAPNPTTCATTIATPTTDCPVTMAVAVTNLSAATTTFRVGDVVRADVTLTSITDVQFNAVQVAMEFDAGELSPVSDAMGRTAIAPTSASESLDRATFHLASGTFGANATILRNTYSVVGTGADSGRARLDAGVTLPASGTASPVSLTQGTSVVAASIYLRILNNPASTGTPAIALRDSAATDARYGLVAMVDADDGGYNILGPVVGATLDVAHTAVGARLVVATPPAGAIRRVGDVVPVRLVVDATTAARNARTIRATVDYAATQLGLVSAATGNGGAPPSFVASGTFAPDLAASVLGASPTNRSTHGLGAASGTIKLDLEGTPLDLASGAGDATVATLYFRVLDRGELSLTVGSVQVGDRSLDATADPQTLAFPVAVSTTPTASLPAVRGSVGVEVATVGSPLAQPDGSPLPLTFTTAATSSFTVTDGRYLDLEVRALAGPADSQGVDHMAVDLALPDGLSLVGGESGYVLAPDLVADPTTPSAPAVSTTNSLVSGATSVVTVRARTASATFHTASPIARIRLAVATATFGPSASPITVAVAPTTSLSQTGTRFVTNLHDDATDVALTPLDVLPTVTRQPPATVVIPLRLQGRTTADPASRFIQPIEAFLAVPGATTAAVRHATTAPPAALASAASATMRYLTTSAGTAEPANASISLPDLDPGTYDLFLKGRSSLGARVAQVTLLAGDTNASALAGPVTLLEGDADRSDAINIGDFVVLATTYARPATTDPAIDTADFNQSGYVDAFDFSLLARNYAVRGPITLATLGVGSPLPTRLAKNEPSEATFTIAVPAGERLTSAKVSVTADARLGLACATPRSGTTCLHETPTRVSLTVAPVGGAAGGTSVEVGAISLTPNADGAANLTATLVEAKGTDAAAKASTYRAPSITSTIVVDPDVLFAATAQDRPATDTMPAGINVGASVTSNSAAVVTGGTITVTWDSTRLQVATSDPCAVPVDMTGVACDWTTPGLATFTVIEPGLPVDADYSLPVPLMPVTGAPPGSTSVHVRVANLVDGVTDSVHVASALTAAPVNPGDDVVVVTVTATGDPNAPTVSANRLRASTVRSRATRPTVGTWLSVPDGPVAPGAIVPVEVRIAAGTAVDAAQVVLRVGAGFRVVDADGQAATGDTAIIEAGASPLPVILRRAVDGVSGLVELAFGRQIGQGAGGATGDGRLATILLKAPTGPTGASVPALSIVPAGAGQFASVIVGADGLPIASSGAVASIEVDALASSGDSVDLGPSASPVDPVIGPPAISGVVDAGTGTSRTAVVAAPVARTGAARGATAVGGSGRNVLSTQTSATHRAVVADVARGVVRVVVPGRLSPIEVRAGITTDVPDAWCPVARYQTYVRLQDVGIAGATFGVQADGALAWVPPDQSGCVDWAAIETGGLTFGKEVIMQFDLARAAPGALLWVLDGSRSGELYEVDANGVATYVTADALAANRAHFTDAWANVIPVGTAQVENLAVRGMVSR